jgi:hypothetical protein
MLINIIDATVNDLGEVIYLNVTDGNQVMTVTPSQVFQAMLDGKMESDTARLSIYGLDIIINGQCITVPLKITSSAKRKLQLKLGLIPQENMSKTDLQEDKKLRLERERAEYLKKQQKWFEENKAKAEEARQKGLVNLSMEQRRKLRQENFSKIHKENMG